MIGYFNMYLVWKIIKPKPNDKIEDIALGCLSLITISLYQTHFGYMPVYEKYEDAVGYFPNDLILTLPLYEILTETVDESKTDETKSGN